MALLFSGAIALFFLSCNTKGMKVCLQGRRYNRQGRKANVGAGTATATEPTREHKQYATQGPTTYLCT